MPHQFYLAPLRGVTDTIFRTVFESCFGCFDYLLTPFLTTVKGKEVAPSHLKDITGIANDRQRVVPQMLGNDADDLLLLARAVQRLGYPSVNWNLGCPHQQVTRKKRGSGLLPFPELVDSILARLVVSLPCTLSVKVRLGLEQGDELERLMPVLNSYPLREVIIHPRTGKQGYSGSVDLDRFASVAARCRHPVVYNGDIVTLQQFTALRQRFPGISHWMIGRGAAYNPALLKSLREGCVCTVETVLLRRFHDDLFLRNRRILFGPAHLLGKMKEFWGYFSSNFGEGKKVLKKIQRCTTVDQYCRLVDDVFAGC
jgi:tRNA-dihydrouridine synthase B